MALLPSSFPIYGYIGMMGVPNGDNVIASTAHRIGELEGPIPSAFDWSRVLGWYRSLPGMIRHHVDRRLDKNQRTDPSMTDIALLWIGSTPVDAIIGYPGCTFQIGLWINSTPALSIIPADIGRRASGWFVVYPAAHVCGVHVTPDDMNSTTSMSEIQL